MTRYGRNQKRAHRAALKALEEQLAASKEELAQCRWRLQRALSDACEAEGRAFERFAKQSGMLANITETMAREVGRYLGPLESAAAKALAVRDRGIQLSLRADDISYRNSRVITVDVPAARLDYAVDCDLMDASRSWWKKSGRF